MSNLPAIIQERGILPEVFSALKNSIFPGASDESVVMAWDYCTARKLDVMLKPVHLVPMSVKDSKTGKSDFRDVVMPGIGLYRIQADRAGNYAGMSAPVFGPDISENFDSTDYNNKPIVVSVTYPEWCEITVSKLMGDRLVTFTSREYWIENYATAGKSTKAPNTMWQKRPRGQLVKCTEAQALRKGWPELGAQPTAEEMEGKEIDITPKQTQARTEQTESTLPVMDAAKFAQNFPSYEAGIKSGRKTADQVITTIQSKFTLTAEQESVIRSVPAPIEGQAEEVIA
jgi:phage recombination protein Bet